MCKYSTAKTCHLQPVISPSKSIQIFCKKSLSEHNFRLCRFHCLVMSLLQHIFLETETVTKISVGKMSVYNMPEHNWQSFPFFERIIIRVVACLVSKTNYFEVLPMVLSTYIYISWGREENVAVFRCHRQQKGVEEFEDTRRKTTVRWKKSSFGAFCVLC